MIAAVIYAEGSSPLRWWLVAVLWLALIGLLSFLMVSTWRYPSAKGINFGRPRSPLTIIVVGALIFLIWIASEPVLLIITLLYVGSGIAIRIGGVLKRMRNTRSSRPEHQVS